MESKPMKLFLICPVRGHSIEETERYVEDLEMRGFEVHWPPRDTKQEDELGGINICDQNRAAMEEADGVAVIWNPNSYGCHFDLGMAFAMRKPLMVVLVQEQTKEKSFINVIHFWRDGDVEDLISEQGK